ncbi:hypothetical protein SAMN05216241_11335 [Limimonas halophila]|uniref:Cyclophilin TM1367-like domain-containing protein n=1 Tax=Limimonas halophila TaxID=1082479 RepID=A0A1G7UDJ8_9PROT|nr:cyclophilin-like fold protein [Limimonas halophila]SDG44830.1 hypothetical protein SAMN05216241_11335 [Limimonas halophila]
MSTTVRITIGDTAIDAVCRDTPTARAVVEACPFTAEANVWGEEVFFSAPIDAGDEADQKQVVEPGEIAYWVQGGAIAIGFGPTPASTGDEIRLVAPTNIWADAVGDVRALKAAKAGDPVRVEAV